MEILRYLNKPHVFTKRFLLVLFLFYATFIGTTAGIAAEAPKIAILPFNIYSKTPAAFLQGALYDGLSRELGKTKDLEIVEKRIIQGLIKDKIPTGAEALAFGKSVNVSHVISGSLTEIGDRINVDITILDVTKGKILPPLSRQGKGMESLSALITQLKDDILIKLSAKQRIAKINVQGNQKIESVVILQVLKGRPGGLFSESQLSEDIKAIYKLGYFEDVVVDVMDTPEGKILNYQIKERGLITAISIKGNKALDTSDIESSLTFKTKQTLNREKLASSIDKIKNLYDSKGYYNAEITSNVDKVGEKDLRVIFTIKEHEKLYVQRISFAGNSTFRDKEIKKIIKTAEKDFFYWFTDAGVLKKDQLRQDMAKINVFYLNNGFIHATVGEPEVSFDKKGIYIKISIVEGKRFKVGKINITGDTLKVSKEQLLKGLTITKKEFFDRGAIMKDIEYLTAACNDEGYAYVDISPQTQTDEKGQKVDVTFDIFKGSVVHFNRITVTGNHKTRDKVIRQLLAIKEGDIYNSSNLKLSYKKLERTRFFEEIDFQAEKGPNETLTNINIRVKEKSTGMFSVGAGYSALAGAMVMASISQQNLLGRGQSLSLRASLGQNASFYNISFVDPFIFDTLFWSRTELYNNYQIYDTYTLGTKGFGQTLGYPIWEKVYAYLGYSYYISDVYDVLSSASSTIKSQAGKLITSSLSPTLTRDTTDDNFSPTKGSMNSLYMTYAGLGGDTGYMKYGAYTSWYFPLPADMVFDIKSRIGYVQRQEGKILPVYEKYWIGGIQSVRGLRYVGPRDPASGDLIGGNTSLYFNVDLVFPLIKNAGIKGVVFFDTGNAWEYGYDLGDMRKTAGVGIRWYSPVGPLRLEWGYVLDRKGGEDPYRFEFTMGMMM